MKKLLFASIGALSILLGCHQDEKTAPSFENLVALRIPYDTLIVDSEAASVEIPVFGLEVKSDTVIRINQGYLTRVEKVYYNFDSTESQVNFKYLQWQIENTAILKPKKGALLPQSSGETDVKVVLNGIESNNVHVIVTPNTNYTAPDLSLDDPQTVYTFSPNFLLSGRVDYGALVDYEGSSITYDSKGKFSYGFDGLEPGENLVTVRAAHPKNSSLITSKSKKYVYADINSIIGDWEGTTLGQTFYFSITKSNSGYAISGKITLNLGTYGVQEDIEIDGLVDQFGQIDCTLKKTTSNYTIVGNLIGNFDSTTTSLGTYLVKVSDGTFYLQVLKEQWSAVKL